MSDDETTEMLVLQEAVEWASEVGCEGGGPVGCEETWPDDRGRWCRACRIRAILRADGPVRAPRNYPHGRLSADDEGEIAIRIATKKGTVVVDFGKKVAWLGMPPKYAREFAALLTNHAAQAEKGA